MRIGALRLLAWGRFDREELELGPPGALTVVYGPNEAGKSTALRALSALLFGIPRGTPDAYLHGAAEVRVGGRLEAEDGRVLDLVRRRSARPPLVDAAGRPVTEAAVSELLGGVGREAFETMFALDHVRLREGARALASGRGELGEALLSAATGTVTLHRSLAELRRSSDAIFTPRAPKRPLLGAVRAFHEARRRVRELEVLPHGWLESEAAIAEEERREAELEAERSAVALERARIRAVRELTPLLARRGALERTLDALSHAAGLDPELGARREELERSLERCEEERALLAARAADLDRALAELPPPLRLDEAALERVRAALARLDASAPLRARAALELARLGPADAAPARGGPALDPRLAGLAAREEELRPLARAELSLKSELETLLRRRAGLEARAAAQGPPAEPKTREEVPRPGGRRRAGAGRGRRAAEGNLELLPTPESDEALRQALAEALRLDAPESRRAAEERAARGRALRDELLQRLPAERAPSSLPAPEAVDELAARVAALAARRVEAESARANAEARRASAARGLEAIAAAGPLPDLAALEAARRERSRLVRALVDADGKRARAALGAELERLHADLDERIAGAARDADRLARRAALEAEAVDAAVAASAADRAAAEHAASLSALTLGASSLDELRGWARAARDLSRAEREIAEAEAALRALDAQRAEALRRLAGLGVRTMEEATAELERRARARDEEAAALVERRALEVGLRDVELELERARTGLAAFEGAWRRLLAELGVGEDEPAPTVGEALEAAARLDQAARGARARDELRATVEEADRAHAELAARLAGLGVPPGDDPRAAASRVLDAARREAAERGPKEIERETARSRLARLDGEREALLGRLTALAAEVGAADRADIARVEADLARRLEAARELAALEARIEDRLEGRRDELLELLELPPSALADRDARLEEREVELDGEIRRARQRAAGARVGQEQMGSRDAAEREAELAEEALAEARALATEWAVQRVMLALASAEMERYRTEHKGPLLERASSALRDLTRGAYAGVDAVVEDGVPTLVCLRPDRRAGPDGVAAIGIPALSDGTLDQLYLALRIATWEAHAATRAPLPVVLDDVLVHFDDDRSRGALAALSALAQTLQVVVFTHHERVVELAREAAPSGRLHEVRLHAG